MLSPRTTFKIQSVSPPRLSFHTAIEASYPALNLTVISRVAISVCLRDQPGIVSRFLYRPTPPRPVDCGIGFLPRCAAFSRPPVPERPQIHQVLRGLVLPASACCCPILAALDTDRLLVFLPGSLGCLGPFPVDALCISVLRSRQSAAFKPPSQPRLLCGTTPRRPDKRPNFLDCVRV